MKVYQAIQAVASQMAKDGISKSRDNKQQGFKFRGIDETLNALAPVLSTHGLVILPRMLSRAVTERETKNGGALFSVVVDAEFDFVSSEDGSKHTVKTYGEAMDTADKATNKAMSIAYKYAAFLAFCIPVEGMGEDADATKHDVAAKGVSEDGYKLAVAMLDGACEKLTRDEFRQLFTTVPEPYRNRLTTTDRATLDAMVKRTKPTFPSNITVRDGEVPAA